MDPQPSSSTAPMSPTPPNTPNKKYMVFAGLGLFFLLSCILVLTLVIGPRSGTSAYPTPTPINGSNAQRTNVITTSPKNNEKESDYTGDITMTFAYKVNIDTLRFSLSPTTQGALRQLTESSFSFKPTRFLQNTTRYNAKVEWRNPKNELVSYTWTFTTDTPSGEENASLSDIEAFQKARMAADKANQERRTKFPFITSLPMTTPDYKIEITSNDTIVITTFGTTPELTKKYKEEALAWLTSRGGVINNLTIQYADGSK